MSSTVLVLLTLASQGVGRLANPNLVQRMAQNDASAMSRSIASELSAPTFLPYVKPTQRIEEFIALGDSYTAGTGCNGRREIIAGDAVRGARAYPMQMAADEDNWSFVNGGAELPRFSFHAYTGDKTEDLVVQQLKHGQYKDDRNLPRNQPFGKPQIAVVTIGGNDAELGNIVNDCILQGWKPGNCEETLARVQRKIDTGELRNNINNALYHIAFEGRQAGGSDPPESFQVFVLGYLTFFNVDNPECDSVCWNPWPWKSEPKLRMPLRRRLNDLAVRVSEQIRLAAQDLERMGVIFVPGPDHEYDGHRYCEPGHTDQKMVDYETWFWSPSSKLETASEGPGDPNEPYPASVDADSSDPAQEILDFVFPGQGHQASSLTAEDSEPWEWEGAEKYPSWYDLLTAMQRDGDVNATGAPFYYMRSFHPKATAYGIHAAQLFAAISDNRDIFSADSGSESSDIPAPACASTGTEFEQALARDSIATFCGVESWWNLMVVPPISMGDGLTSDGVRKIEGITQRYQIPGTSNMLQLGLDFAKANCTGSFMFASGQDDSAKLDHCTARFGSILDRCQTDTTDGKLGGTLQDVCAVYTVVAAPGDDLFLDVDPPGHGDFECKPTDTSAVGGDSSVLANTCTCWYTDFPDNNDIFKMPSSGNCDDTKKWELLTD